MGAKPRDVPRLTATIPPITVPILRVHVVPRGILSHGKRFECDGTSIYQVDYQDKRALAIGIKETRTGPVALGECAAAYRDSLGRWVLYYSRGGNTYRRVKTSSGGAWSSETMVLTGYSFPAAVYLPKFHRLVMVAVTGGRIKALLWTKAASGDTPLTTDPALAIDIGASDAGQGDIEDLEGDGGTLQVWWPASGNVTTMISRNQGRTWAAP